MSRRALQPRAAGEVKALSRMAPGGRMWSESEIEPFWRPIGEMGEGDPEEAVRYYPGPACPGRWPPCGDAGNWYYEGVQGFYWITWQGPETGCPPKSWVEQGHYYTTFHLKLTSTYAGATSLLIGCQDFTWFQDAPDDNWFTLTGGPWSAGDVLSFTLWSYLSETSVTYSLFLMNPTPGAVPSEWELDCSESYFTVKPAPDPVAAKRSIRPPASRP